MGSTPIFLFSFKAYYYVLFFGGGFFAFNSVEIFLFEILQNFAVFFYTASEI